MKDAELFLHLKEFVFGEHVQLASFLHEDSEFAAVREYFIVVFCLDPSYFLLEDVHKNLASDVILSQLHDVLVWVVLWLAKEVAVALFCVAVAVVFESFCLQLQLVVEFHALVLCFEGDLN